VGIDDGVAVGDASTLAETVALGDAVAVRDSVGVTVEDKVVDGVVGGVADTDVLPLCDGVTLPVRDCDTPEVSDMVGDCEPA
jgi:hypothetical protein